MIGVYDWRPACAAEVLGAYCGAIGRPGRQHVMCLSRQNVTECEGASAVSSAKFGCYCIYEGADAKFCVLASGAEVGIAVEAAKLLGNVRVCSLVSYTLFREQSQEYQEQVFGGIPRERRASFEPYVAFGLEGLCAHNISIETYG